MNLFWHDDESRAATRNTDRFMTLENGYQLQQGRYLIQSVLGEGGMGTVYLATDRNLPGRLVAIKENADATQAAQAQFQQEAVMLARLTHPNLPRVTDHFVEPTGRQYLVMDYVEGDDLREVLRQQGGPLPEPLVLAWIEQVINALEHMHNWIDPATRRPSPIIHRDIKPGNIKRTPNGRIVLVDFGLAKYESDEEPTVVGARAFTPGYSPVEQYSGGTNVRSDIYALGATLYNLLTGQRPPDATALAGGAPLAPPRQVNPQISRNTERVILRAMQAQESERFQNVRAMHDALLNRRSDATDRVPATQPRSEYTLSTYTKRTERRTSGLIAWLVGLLLLALLAAGLRWSTPLLERWRTLSNPGNSPSTAIAGIDVITATAIVTATAIITDAVTTTPTALSINAVVSSTTNTPPTIVPMTATLSPTPPPLPATATPTVTATVTPLPTVTASPTAPPTPMPSATATHTASPSNTAPPPTATTVPTQPPTATRTPAPTNTPQATDTPTAPPTVTDTPTNALPTATVTPRPTATTAPTVTTTPLPTATLAPTVTSTDPPTATNTAIPTVTRPATATRTATSTPQPTATVTPRPTLTSTPTPHPTDTVTRTPTVTRTATVPPRPTATRAPSATPTAAMRPTASATPTVLPVQAPPAAGDQRVNPRDQARYVFVPSGDFLMGSTIARDEQPEHTVTITGFWIGQTEVTNAQYARCIADGACTPPHNDNWTNPDQADFPVTHVDWEQANTYAQWAGGRLPTEAEWEKAARGTDGRTFPWGDDVTDEQRLNFNAMTGAVAVGSYPAGASPYGALDMAGNVEEWVADWYAPDAYAQSSGANPTGPTTGILRVVRGGSFKSSGGGVRTSVRGRAAPAINFDNVGFRVVVPAL